MGAPAGPTRDCQQHLDGQAIAVKVRGIAGLRSIDILRREVAGGEVEFITILMFDDWAAVDAFASPDRAAAVIPAAARQWLRSYDKQSQHYDLVAHHADRPAGPAVRAAQGDR
jgi:antibiotic biosynthesis monooxygenase (ABM) superfamily enzyme